MKRVYLVLAVLGGILPYLFFSRFILLNGFDLPAFASALFANFPAGGFTADLLFTSVVFWLMMFVERRHRSGPNPLPFILLNLLVGLSCALPAWLYARMPAEARSSSGVSSV